MIDTLSNAATIAGNSILVFAFIIALFTLFIAVIGDEDDKERLKSVFKSVNKKHIKAVSIVFIICLFTPTKDTGYKMLAAYGVNLAINNDRIGDVADKSLQVIEKAMGEYLKEEEDK